MDYYNSNTELYHHGILGQKWGVRRYQYEDGTLTPEGKKRYYKNGYDASGGLTKAGKKWQKKVKKEEAYKKDIQHYGKQTADMIRYSKAGLKIAGGIMLAYPLINIASSAGAFVGGAALRQHGKKIVDEVMRKSAELKSKPGGTEAFDRFMRFGAEAEAQAGGAGMGNFAAQQVKYVAYGLQDIENRAYNAINNAKYNAKYKYYRANDWIRGHAAPIRDVFKRKSKSGFYPPAVR